MLFECLIEFFNRVVPDVIGAEISTSQRWMPRSCLLENQRLVSKAEASCHHSDDAQQKLPGPERLGGRAKRCADPKGKE